MKAFLKSMRGAALAGSAVVEIGPARRVEFAPGVPGIAHTVYYRRGDEVLQTECTALAVSEFLNESE